MQRVKSWFPYGLVLLGVFSLISLSTLPWSSSEASVRPSAFTAASTTSTLRGLAVDVIDGKTVAHAWLDTVDANGVKTSREVTAADGLTWTVTGGTSQIEVDAFTGRSRFLPSGSQPVTAVPELGGLTGGPVDIGINASVIPTIEREIVMAGGGLCAQNPNHQSVFLRLSSVDVRSVIDLTAIPLSATERVLRFRRGEYYAYDPQAGPMRLTFNPAKVSGVTLKSLDPTGQDFFPASVEVRAHFIIEMLNTGMRVFNEQPLVFRNPASEWPPFSEPMISEAPVSFYLMDNPTVEALRIENQESYLYPSEELAVDLLSRQITGGVLEATYRVRNLTSAGGTVRWFFLGDLGTPITAPQGTSPIGPNGQLNVTLRTQLHASELSQTITFGAVTQDGARLTGTRKLRFQFPTVSSQGAGTPVATP